MTGSQGYFRRWLGSKSHAEKRFSWGCFSVPYLLKYDMAIVRSRENEPVAFANLWQGRRNMSYPLT
ncbi:MAG: DUF2156 domain-containing protein [Pirellulaceae bacterium]|nr:DUF2156 domain-containing protein [Pirellulaceae bacterium]